MVPTDEERWDDRHERALAEGAPPRPPADLLREHAGLLGARPRGRALDVAAGLGRNTLYLARLGFAVDAVDVSGVAVAHLARRAAAEDLPVRALRADLAAEPLPEGPYEVVVQCFFLDRRLWDGLPGRLAPGGLLLVETFLPDPGAAYGPHDPERVLEPGELRTAFPGLEVVAAAEGPRTTGARPTARLVARRPVPA